MRRSTHGRVRLFVVLAAVTAVTFLLVLPGKPSFAQALNISERTDYPVGDFQPNDVEQGDFNDDGNIDLASANLGSGAGAGSISILLGDGNGHFGPPSTFSAGPGNFTHMLAVGDLNGDNHADVVAGKSFAPSFSVLFGDGQGNLSAPADYASVSGVKSVAIGEFNGDGRPDIVAANSDDNTGSDSISLFLNDGQGVFLGPTNFPVGDSPREILVGRLNADAFDDVATADNSSGSVSVLLGDGAGGFANGASISVDSQPISLDSADMNGDSVTDLVVANSTQEATVRVLTGDGAGNFTLSDVNPVNSPQSLALADFNGDGLNDVVVTGGSSISILLGNGAGQLDTGASYLTGVDPNYLTVGDFKEDTKPDIAVTQGGGGSIGVLLNESGPEPPEPPGTEIDDGPIGLTNDNTPTFDFSSPEPAATFECRVDGNDFAGCSSPHTTEQLLDGEHTFAVRASDEDGTDQSPATRTIIVDTIPPDATITSGPDGPTSDNTPTFEYSFTEAPDIIECWIDDGFNEGCGPSTFTTRQLADGPHTFYIRATDRAGNADQTPASRSFHIDTDTSGAITTIDSGPTGPTSDNTPTFTFSSEPGTTFQCHTGSGVFAECSSPYTTAPQLDGPRTFFVRAIKAGEDIGPTVSRDFRVCTGLTGPLAVTLDPLIRPALPPVADLSAGLLCPTS